jgi:tRNA(fMet)-specific endonuclease VapC
MRPLLIDTNAYTAFKLGHASIIEIFQSAPIIGVSPIVLGELLGGFDNGRQSLKNRQELHMFLSSSRIRIFPLSADTANFYAHVYAKLKAKGPPIPSNDMWIAAQSLEQGSVLCTFDKHFKSIDGLIVGNTLTELGL